MWFALSAVSGNRYVRASGEPVVGFLVPAALTSKKHSMQVHNPLLKKVVVIGGIALALALSVVSYQYLALALFYAGLGDFYELAGSVPEICTAVVADAAVAFTGVYDYISLAVAGTLLLIAVYLAWRLFAGIYGSR